jgi:hypothetical protein
MTAFHLKHSYGTRRIFISIFLMMLIKRPKLELKAGLESSQFALKPTAFLPCPAS